MQTGEMGAALDHYHDVGYAVLPMAVPTVMIDAAEALLDARERSWEQRLAGRPDGRSWISHAGEITFTARLAGSAPGLVDLLTAPALSEFMTAVMGPSVRLYFDQAVYKKPGCSQVVPWHQDNGYNPKTPADYVSFWIAVTDTTVENGTLRVRPAAGHRVPFRTGETRAAISYATTERRAAWQSN